MNCTDCICSEVCYYKAFNDEKHLKKRRNDVEKICKSFVHSGLVKVMRGHWTATDAIVHKAGYGVRYYYHAECKVNPNRLFECENDYCPNCGAKMDGDGNEQ